jgi:hypothetical protein
VQVRKGGEIIKRCGHVHSSWIGTKQCRKNKARLAEGGDSSWLNAAAYPAKEPKPIYNESIREGRNPASRLHVVSDGKELPTLYTDEPRDKELEEQMILEELERWRSMAE